MENTRHVDVLVIDDDDAPFQRIKDLFAATPDITVYGAATLAQALQLLAANNIGCVIAGERAGRARGLPTHRVIRETVPDLPIFWYSKKKPLIPGLKRSRLKKEGIAGLLWEPLSVETVSNAIFRSAGQAEAGAGSREEILFSPLRAEERFALLQTALDILNHDTKDLFVRILSILSDIPENEYSGILTDYINELFESTSEALGFITAQKRLESLIDLVNGIRIGNDKIPLPSASRIEIAYDPRKLLFVETSRLLKNAIANIIDNALAYSPPAEKVRLGILRRGPDILLTVADRGQGIPRPERHLVFTKNPRLPEARTREGSGKGLWIASHIVKEERGDISIQDNPGGGTLVTVRLPAFDLTRSGRGLADLSDWFKLPLEVVEKKARIMKTILLMELPGYAEDADSLVFTNLLDHFRDERRKKERQKYFFKLQEYTRYNQNGAPVLLVDDSLYVHYSIAPVLVDEGLRIVDFAFNGVEAFNLYQIYRPALVILDITMPVKSGIETAQDIYKMNPAAKILFITALGEYKPFQENIERLFGGRNYRLLAKPIRPPKLGAAVRDLLSANEVPLRL